MSYSGFVEDIGDGVPGPPAVRVRRPSAPESRRRTDHRRRGLGAPLPHGADPIATVHRNPGRKCTAMLPEDVVEGIGRVKGNLASIRSKLEAVDPHRTTTLRERDNDLLATACATAAQNLRVLADEVDELALSLPADADLPTTIDASTEHPSVVVFPHKVVHGITLIEHNLDTVRSRLASVDPDLHTIHRGAFDETLTQDHCTTAANNFRVLATELDKLAPAFHPGAQADRPCDAERVQ